ncbi:NADP-dependent oxidoreductase [Streptomyces sp. NBC_01775]|uniref:NADP-dependent oxidoreductase n=1 Tax=Streptomyces sp. NBC_01775 TaxID=2975939 RepID=UPI002DD7C110|nr:NADP-dependent oxidoreductase [Streptomyces sp. NBC_01775]WSB79931.1 NADP-dependent oxidoreductase [Streptomyces sp. NBC_01775]
MPEAIAFAAYGGPDVLKPTSIDIPEPDPTQVRVAVREAGVNPLDWKLRSGAMAAFMPLELPWIPGFEVAGTVEETGDGVSGLQVGDEVFGRAPHAYATHVIADAGALVHRPEDLDARRAAALPVAAEAAYRALEELNVGPGETVLVHGAAGVVGNLAVHFALERGARVIGTAGEAAHDRLTALGAEPVTYGEGWADRVRAVAPHGVDAVLDASGADVLGDSVALAEDGTRVLTLADPAAAQEHGALFSGGGPDADRTGPALELALALYRRGALDVPLHAPYPLAEAAEAHRRGEAGGLDGKLVLTVE